MTAFVKFTNDQGDIQYLTLYNVIVTDQGGIVGSNYDDDFVIPPDRIVEAVIR